MPRQVTIGGRRRKRNGSKRRRSGSRRSGSRRTRRQRGGQGDHRDPVTFPQVQGATDNVAEVISDQISDMRDGLDEKLDLISKLITESAGGNAELKARLTGLEEAAAAAGKTATDWKEKMKQAVVKEKQVQVANVRASRRPPRKTASGAQLTEHSTLGKAPTGAAAGFFNR